MNIHRDMRKALLSSIRPTNVSINGMEDDEGSIEVGKVIEVDNESEGLECYPCFKSSEEAKLSRTLETQELPSQQGHRRAYVNTYPVSILV